MSDYGDPINIYEYKYRRPVYYTNPYSTYTTNIVAKLVLTSANFNFNLTKEDGSDFRLLSGMGVLKMWKAYWSKVSKHAVLFFKIPNIGGDATIILSAYWGNLASLNVSDPGSMEFLFYETFSSSTLSTQKWSGRTSNGNSIYGYLFPDSNFAESITNPFQDKNSWIMDAGIYANFSAIPAYYSDLHWAINFEFVGTENNFGIGIVTLDKIKTNAVPPAQSSYSFMVKSYGGLEPYSYQDICIDYYEPDDRITVKIQNRNTYPDVEYQIWRKVEGDTRIKNIRIRGREYYGAGPSYISWLTVRERNSLTLSNLDGRDLYIPYANVPSSAQDFRTYSLDFTSPQYKHETSFGGNPYLLSDNGFDSNTNVWISDNNASIYGVALTIHTGWSEDITDTKFIHYDSNHVYYYNASKLSDNNMDKMDRNYWNCTTTSGWSAINFPEGVAIGAFRIKPTTDLLGCPKNFAFYGSNFNPLYNFDLAIKLVEGTFELLNVWQARVLINPTVYTYYILDILNTYNNKNIKIQEWEMMDNLGQIEKKYPSQLRLHPAIFGNFQYNFPKEISLQGSIDSVNWTTLLPWTYTYTPFVKHYVEDGYWQIYSFGNNVGFWSFRLLCRGNWEAEDNKIIIGEWSLHELESESYTQRVLDGTTNNIQHIWATNKCSLDDKYGIIFAANEKMNRIANTKLVGSTMLPDYYEDFNVVYNIGE